MLLHFLWCVAAVMTIATGLCDFFFYQSKRGAEPSAFFYFTPYFILLILTAITPHSKRYGHLILYYLALTVCHLLISGITYLFVQAEDVRLRNVQKSPG